MAYFPTKKHGNRLLAGKYWHTFGNSYFLRQEVYGMSRIGLKPVEIPEGVDVKLDGNNVTVKGPKGELTRNVHPDMKIVIEDNVLTVERPTEHKEHRAQHGTTRSLIMNMIEGVHKG